MTQDKKRPIGDDESQARKKTKGAAQPSVDMTRVRCLRSGTVSPVPTKFEDEGCIVYWMSRDIRSVDNWALLYAQREASLRNKPLAVLFNVVPNFLGAQVRQYGFMLKGLKETRDALLRQHIPLYITTGKPSESIPNFLEANKVALLVTDFSPLRINRQWKEELVAALPESVLVHEVDAHNVVPVWVASPKLEYAARTIRPKIGTRLQAYMTEFPPVVKQEKSQMDYFSDKFTSDVDVDDLLNQMGVERNVKEVDWAIPGETQGLKELSRFCKNIKVYAKDRNDPTKKGQSNLSPWIHFGMLSAQRAALEADQLRSKAKESVDGFIEELVIRRELADNFCYYQPDYDNLNGAYGWARDSLTLHAADKRSYIYSEEELEKGKTHDELWNAAQLEMVHLGKMHGFMRMYWAKKILEWTPSPEEALRLSIHFNDKYSLDGRDPNGYVGCMWSIAGIHDMGWKERPVFGKIRYMNYDGCKRKFNVLGYIGKIKSTIGGKKLKFFK